MVWNFSFRNLQVERYGRRAPCCRSRFATISESRTSVSSRAGPFALSSENVCVADRFGSSSEPISASNHPPASLPLIFQPVRGPTCRNAALRNASSSRDKSPTRWMPMPCRASSVDFPDAGNFADVERRKEISFLPGKHPEYSVGLRLVGANFRNKPRGGQPKGAVQRCFPLHGVMERVGRLKAVRAAARCR